MAIQLDYAVATEPFPLVASTDTPPKPSKLTIVASNPDPTKPVTIRKKIIITLPIGTAANELTADAPEDGLAPKNWKFIQKKDGQHTANYEFAPDPNHKTITDEGLAFVFTLGVNMQPGMCLIYITEDTENITNVSVAKFPPGWKPVTFGVKPANIDAGQSVELTWAGPPKAEYTIEYREPPNPTVWLPKDGKTPFANVGKYPGPTDPPLTLEASTTFTIHVDLDEMYAASDQRTVTVSPRPPSIEYFRPRNCTASECVIYGDEMILEWDFKYAQGGRYQLIQDWPDFPERPAVLVTDVWTTKFAIVKPFEKNTRYTLMLKKDLFEVTATVSATLIPPVPISTIVPYGSLLANNLPPGWLYCNGAEFSKAMYPQLYAVIGDTYGNPRTTGNFKIPDLRGYFIRGYDDGRGIDINRKMGTYQDDSFRSHTHGQKVTANPGTGGCQRSDFNGDSKNYSEYDQGVQTYDAGGIETRPKNMATYFIIYAGTPKTAQAGKPILSAKGKATKSKKSAARSRTGKGRKGR